MGRRQGAPHRHRQAGGDHALTPRRALFERLSRHVDRPRVVDSPAFPDWDVSCPVREADRARELAAALQDWPLLEAVEPRGTFVNVRWSDQGLRDALDALIDDGQGLPHVEGVRAYRRCLDFVRMAAVEHPDLGPKNWGQAPILDRTKIGACPYFLRALASQLEWLAAALAGDPRSNVCRRLAAEVSRRVDALYAGFPLLRGTAAEVGARARVLEAAAAALRIQCRLGG